MTTMDVGIGGPNGSVHLANGLSGTATAVFFAASEALDDRRAEGMAGAAGCEVTMKGAVLQEVLDGTPWTNLYRGSPPPRRSWRASATRSTLMRPTPWAGSRSDPGRPGPAFWHIQPRPVDKIDREHTHP